MIDLTKKVVLEDIKMHVINSQLLNVIWCKSDLTFPS